jgi:hypothetical protein
MGFVKSLNTLVGSGISMSRATLILLVQNLARHEDARIRPSDTKIA